MNFNLKNMFAIDKKPAEIQFAQSTYGKSIIIIVFTLVLMQLCRWWLPAAFIITAISFKPQYRRLWLMIGMLWLTLQSIYFGSLVNWRMLTPLNNNLPLLRQDYLQFICVVMSLFVSILIIYLTNRFQDRKLMRYPVLNLFVINLVFLGIASYAPLPAVQKIYFWTFVLVFCHYFWFLGYTLVECKSFTRRDFFFECARYNPIWGSSATPLPKGANYLRHIEAKNAGEFAVVQLKGLKLILWAFVLNYIFQHLLLLDWKMDIPNLSRALRQYGAGMHYSCARSWLCLVNDFALTLLKLAVWSHTFIAICRMCGYKALRNMYKPLQAKTIAEFWNRYYFYFKELLVEFFFYPTYFRFFKTMPRVRIFFATLAAATLGVVLFHLFSYIDYIVKHGLFGAIRDLHVYIFFYALPLGIAIGLSQLRNSGNEDSEVGEVSRVRGMMSTAVVIGFFLLLSIFDVPYRTHDVTPNFKFLLSLFNITW